ncbi:unnamed protein product [Dovyalis caffra]|uniref:HMG box domain-containing protein n=1 Tax=Dovyalis caffra TaxID=77055 RepID=A0AAV1RXD4_9ROSI|nr:unnamed protein product [Dovyalis caffra]
MGNPPRTRKRVHAIRRALDGSAFKNCDNCGVMVAIALADLHECEGGSKNNVKRFKGLNGEQKVVQQRFCEQPRSPFRLFMENFMKTGKIWNIIDIDRKGFETWRNMSKEVMEREPYVMKADEINLAYFKSLIKEIDDKSEVDDEADSAMVGKFDLFSEHYDIPDSFYSFSYEDFESCDTWGRDPYVFVGPRIPSSFINSQSNESESDSTYKKQAKSQSSIWCASSSDD